MKRFKRIFTGIVAINMVITMMPLLVKSRALNDDNSYSRLIRAGIYIQVISQTYGSGFTFTDDVRMM